MVVSKEDFKKYMEHIAEQLCRDDVLSSVLVDEDCTGWISTAPHLIDDIIDLLKDSFGERAEIADDYIGWWLWEIDDEKTNNHIWTEYKGEYTKFTIADLDDLYCVIVDDLDGVKEKCPDKEPDVTVYKGRKVDSVSYDTFKEMLRKEMNVEEED